MMKCPINRADKKCAEFIWEKAGRLGWPGRLFGEGRSTQGMERRRPGGHGPRMGAG